MRPRSSPGLQMPGVRRDRGYQRFDILRFDGHLDVTERVALLGEGHLPNACDLLVQPERCRVVDDASAHRCAGGVPDVLLLEPLPECFDGFCGAHDGVVPRENRIGEELAHSPDDSVPILSRKTPGSESDLGHLPAIFARLFNPAPTGKRSGTGADLLLQSFLSMS